MFMLYYLKPPKWTIKSRSCYTSSFSVLIIILYAYLIELCFGIFTATKEIFDYFYNIYIREPLSNQSGKYVNVIYYIIFKYICRWHTIFKSYF